MTEGTTYNKDFWSEENRKYDEPHFRLKKAARLVNRMVGSAHCDLLDVGCGPATLGRLLRPNVSYHGIDIAIAQPRLNLREIDVLRAPITFDKRQFDVIVAQGLFEYLADAQAQKFVEIAKILNDDGVFLVSYVNFDHRQPSIYWPYSNVQPFRAFAASLAEVFTIVRVIPTSHNWHHSEPNRAWLQAINLHLNRALPVVTPKLAVEYFFVCTSRCRPQSAEGWRGQLAAVPR